VIGDHAGEKIGYIFERKIRDVETSGQTFWVIARLNITPQIAIKIAAGHPFYTYFVLPASGKPDGGTPTKIDKVNEQYSIDRLKWLPMPQNISPVTGRGSALIFDELEIIKKNEILDLWDYKEYQSDSALRFRIGASTKCVERGETSSQKGRMKSRFREIAAIGRLKHPYVVYVR